VGSKMLKVKTKLSFQRAICILVDCVVGESGKECL
jgi:hypothetical protein